MELSKLNDMSSIVCLVSVTSIAVSDNAATGLTGGTVSVIGAVIVAIGEGRLVTVTGAVEDRVVVAVVGAGKDRVVVSVVGAVEEGGVASEGSSTVKIIPKLFETKITQ